MPLAFHASRSTKYDQQQQNAKTNILPFIESGKPIADTRVLEIGCGEGGILEPFIEAGCTCVGVDLNEQKIAFANEAFRDHVEAGKAEFVAGDIYDPEISAKLQNGFDIVIMKDTIEHVYGHTRILEAIQHFLKDGGVLFVGFPPWRMPYGGHQQMTESRIGKLPWYHLLPRPVYKRLLKAFGESERRIEGLMEVVDTRLSINDFERMVRDTGYRVVARQHYLINPIYEYKFGLKRRPQPKIVTAIPWLRDFVTTTCYYLLAVKSE